MKINVPKFMCQRRAEPVFHLWHTEPIRYLYERTVSWLKLSNAFDLAFLMRKVSTGVQVRSLLDQNGDVLCLEREFNFAVLLHQKLLNEPFALSVDRVRL